MSYFESKSSFLLVSGLFLLFFAGRSHGAVRFDVIGAPTEVIHTGHSEVTGSINLVVRGTGNVTGTSTGGAVQIGLAYANPAMAIENATASGIRIFFSAGFTAASPSIVSVENRIIGETCVGFLSVNLLPGATPVEGDFIRIEGVRGRIDDSAAIKPGTDLFVDLQSINDPAAISFTPTRIRVAKSLDGLDIGLSSDGKTFGIKITEGFVRAFVDSDSNNDGVNVNDRTGSGGGALGAPTNSTQFVVRLDGIPSGVSKASWPTTSTTSSTGAVLLFLSSTFSGSTASAIYSYESTNQVGASDIAVETFTLSPGLVFTGGSSNTDDFTASVTLGPVLSSAAGCAAPSSTSLRPQFLEIYEISLTKLSPTSVVKGSEGFTLAVSGTGFLATSTIEWNGESRVTTLVNSRRLSARIPSSDVLEPGTATVTVFHEDFGGARSNPLVFTIKRPALTLNFPRLVTTDEKLTGLDSSEATGFAIANLGGRIAKLAMTAFDTFGVQISGTNIINPAILTLNAGAQLPIVDRQIFGSGFPGSTAVGWVKLETNTTQVVGFFLSFNDSLSALDGADVSSVLLTSFILSEIESDGFTRIHIANPNSQSASLTLELVDSDGFRRTNPVGRTVNSNGAVAEFFTDMFRGVTPSASDYIKVTSDKGVVPFEYLGGDARDVSGLNGQDAMLGATTVYSPQYVVGGSEWESTLSVVNLDTTPGTLSFSFFSDDGSQIGSTQVLSIAAEGKIHISDQNFFVPAGDVQQQGYIEIMSDGVRVAGSVVFTGPELPTFSAALPLVTELQSRIAFSQIASDITYFMGLSILNPNSMTARTIIQVFDRQGAQLAAKIFEIPARGRMSRLLTEYFPSLAGQEISSGYVLITAYRRVAGFALFGTHDLSVLSALPPQIRQ